MIALALGLVLAGSPAAAAEDDGWRLADSNRAGLLRVRTAAGAHGSLADPGLSVTLDVTCVEYRNATQARTPTLPVESYTWMRRYRIDRRTRSESIRTRNEFAGFVFEDEVRASEGRAARYDHRTRTREPVEAIGAAVYHLLPQRYLAIALDNPLTVRARGAIESDGRRMAQVDAAEGGLSYSLYFDEGTGLLARVDLLRHADPYGATVRTYRFAGRQAAGGLTVPSTVRVATRDPVLGTVENVFALAMSPGVDPAGESAPGYPPADYASRPPTAIRTLAEGVYLIENLTGSTGQWSYNVLFAEFADHVLVAEAPLDDETTGAVVERIATVAPGKPIRYLVQTHHHDDHLGGIRGYVARGVRLVVAPGHVDLVGRIARADYATKPDTLDGRPREPVFEPVRDGRVSLSDSRLEAQVIEVGPTAHAQEMLAVYFPASGVLFQSDLVNAGEFPMGELAEGLAAKVKALGLRVAILAGAHGRVVTGDELRRLGF